MSSRKASAKTGSDNVGVRTGRRRGPTYTAVHDWVLYSEASPTAKALYAVLRGHVNDKRADDVTWVSPTALALILGFSRGDKIGPYEKELIVLGAISTVQVGMPAKKIYTVEQFPPAAYAGPINGNEWHDRNGDRVKALIESATAARIARRTKAKTAPAGAPSETAVVPPDRGGHIPPDPGGAIPPVSGRELTPGVSVGVLEDLRTTPSSVEEQGNPAPTAAEPCLILEDRNQEPDVEETAEFVKSSAHWPTLTDWENALLDECLRVPGTVWPSRMVRKVLGSATIREITARDPDLVRRAFLLGAADGGVRGNTVPMRMWHVDQCPHWKRAANPDVEQGTDGHVLGVAATGGSALQPRSRSAAPSPLQETPMDASRPALGRTEELRLASERIAAARERNRAAEPEPRLHSETMAELDRILAQMSDA